MKMKMVKKMNNSMKWMLMASVIILGGCSQPEDLETSVNNRWEKLIAADYEEAFEYFSPAYQEIETLTAFSLRTETAKLKVQWLNGVLKSKECQDEVCEVKVELEYQYFFPRRSMGEIKLKTEIKENWIKLNDRWYFVPSEETNI